MMPIEIRTFSFDPWDEIKLHQQKIDQEMNMEGQYGATASFVGTTLRLRTISNRNAVR